MPECQCCFSEVVAQRIQVCTKDHRVCLSCLQELGRTDCLFCVPHQIIPIVPERVIVRPPTDTTQTRSTSRRPPPEPDTNSIGQPCHHCWRETVECAYFLAHLARYVAYFFLATYLGKVFIAFYFWSNPDRDSSWFGWDRLNNCIMEALVGVVGGAILLGCCANSR